jgi:hypothetical protein
MRKAATLRTRIAKGNPHASSTFVDVLEKTTLKRQREFDRSGRGENHCNFRLWDVRAGFPAH